MRIILVDDHPIVLSGLDRLFGTTPGTEVVARCSTCREAIAAIHALQPDMVLLDLKLGDGSGIGVLKDIRQAKLPVRVVLLSALATPEDVETARRFGADGFVYKDLEPNALVQEVARAAAGLRPFPHLDAAPNRIHEMLTAREIEVVNGVSQGLRNRAIAEQMGISEATVKLHLHRIFEKLKVGSRLELAVIAQECRFVPGGAAGGD